MKMVKEIHTEADCRMGDHEELRVDLGKVSVFRCTMDR